MHEIIESTITPRSLTPRPLTPRSLKVFRTARKGLLALVIKLASAGLALALQVCLARALGHTGYGEYIFILGWFQIALVLANGGFPLAALRYVAEYRSLQEFGLVRGFINRGARVALFESVAISLVAIAGAVFFCRGRNDGMLGGFVIAGCTLPIMTLFMFSGAVIRGLGCVIPSMLVGLVHPLLLLTVTFGLAFLLSFSLDSNQALVLHLACAAAALGIAYVTQKQYERKIPFHAKISTDTPAWFNTATQLMFASLLSYLQGRTGVVITGMLIGSGAAGTYAALEKLADVALLGLVSINFIAAPRFAELHASKQFDQLQRYARLSAWGSTAFMLATVLPLVLFGKTILAAFGPEFTTGYATLPVLISGIAVNAACGANGFLLSMTGHQKITVRVAFVSLCLNVLLSFLLIPQHGIVGAAWANSLSMMTWNLLTVVIIRRRLGIWSCIGPLHAVREHERETA